MGNRSLSAVKPVWTKEAEETNIKSDAENDAVAKAAFELTSIGPVDPSKCTASGAGIVGGTAGAPSDFVLVTKDSDGRKIPNGGAQIKVTICSDVGVGGSDIEGTVKDLGDGSYGITYVAPKRGNYMVLIEINGKSIMGNPFPVFFSAVTPFAAGTSTGGLVPVCTYPNIVNLTQPNRPNYCGSISSSFPGLLGMIPGILSGPSGGAILPGITASLREVRREYLYGRCVKTDCELNHPPQNLLMTALASITSMGSLSQVPMGPSAAAMATAQAIVAAKAVEAHAKQMQDQQKSSKDLSDPMDEAGKAVALKKTLQVSNLSLLFTEDQLKQLFRLYGTVVECTITDSKHFAYIEYSKSEEATAALALNNMDVAGSPLNVEMAKTLPPKTSTLNLSSSLPLMMQQAVAMQKMQKMQFQNALMMEQSMTALQAANRASNQAAIMKFATELASARAAEISRKLIGDEIRNYEAEADPTPRCRSSMRYRERKRSRSCSPSFSFSRNGKYLSYEYGQGCFRDARDYNDRYRRHLPHGRHGSSWRRHKSRSLSPRASRRRKSVSPNPHVSLLSADEKHHTSSRSKVKKKSSSRSPENRIHRASMSPSRTDAAKSKIKRSSRSRIPENVVCDATPTLSDARKQTHHGKVTKRDRR